MKIKVIPNAKRTELKGDRLYIKAIPEKGKANREIIKFFKKEFNQRVEIIKGEKSREKILKILD